VRNFRHGLDGQFDEGFVVDAEEEKAIDSKIYSCLSAGQSKEQWDFENPPSPLFQRGTR